MAALPLRTVRFVGWQPPLLTVSLVKLVRREQDRGLAEALDAVNAWLETSAPLSLMIEPEHLGSVLSELDGIGVIYEVVG